MTIMGVTGQVGSGKSYAVDLMCKWTKARVLDLDLIGHQCLNESCTQQELLQHFGSDIIHDNKIDRKALGPIVFADQKQLDRLNRIIHPKIKNCVEQDIMTNKSEHIIIVGSLIKEIGLINLCDYIIVINSNREKARLISKNKIVAEQYQLTQQEYAQLSNMIVYNNFDDQFTLDLKQMLRALNICGD